MKARISRQPSSLSMFVMAIVHHLESQGIRESTIRKRLRLVEGWAGSLPDSDLVALVPRLLRTSQVLSGDELLLLHAGEHFHFCLAGAGGLVATHAPTPGLALETFGQFVSGAGILDVQTSATSSETTVTLNIAAKWPKQVREQVGDGFFSCLVSALRPLCDPAFTPLRISLKRQQPSDTKAFARALRRNVTFQSQRDEAVFKTDDLTKASRLYEPLLYEQLRFVADLIAGQPSGATPARQLVEQAIRAGNYTIDGVARTLQTNKRVLQRRLQTEDVTFRSVCNVVRVNLAESLLRETDLSVPEIAKRLKYSDDKALRKAIKRVTAKTPMEIRKSSV